MAKKQIRVIGAGGMARPIIAGLSMIGHNVILSDIDKKVEDKTYEYLNKLHFHCFKGTGEPQEEDDLVISCAPYMFNYDIAQKCANLDVMYCDLGGNEDVRLAIQAIERNVPFFTDLGLAPGYGNILLEKTVKDRKKAFGHEVIHNATLMVGGLPQVQYGKMKYEIAFSPHGLVNEYIRKCRVLRNGEVVMAQPLTEIEQVYEKTVGDLEAFLTSGGLGHSVHTLAEDGVMNASYKTLRYPGHIDYLKFLVEDCKLSYDELIKALTNACSPIKDDVVVMMVNVDGFKRSWTVTPSILWTAMQRTTGFPVVVIADMMLNGSIDKITPMYRDVPAEEFITYMNDFNIAMTNAENKFNVEAVHKLKRELLNG